MRKATFAGGNFRCLIEPFNACSGVKNVAPGYIGGHIEHPTRESVQAGHTGHFEAIEVHYDEHKTSYAELLDVFWRQIDPTDDGGQFEDRGSAYRTAIFYHNEEQLRFARATLDILNTSGRFGKPIVTCILPATSFYPAEKADQSVILSESEYQKAESKRQIYLKRTWRKSRRRLRVNLAFTLFPLVLISLLIIYALGVNPAFRINIQQFAQGNLSYPAPIRERVLTAEEAAADAAWLVSLVEETHPVFLDLPEFKDRLDTDYEQAKKEFLETASRSMTVIDFMMLCNYYVTTLHDCHTRVTSPSGGGSLPLSFYWSEEGLFLKPTEQFLDGAQVLSIGGIDVEAIGQSIDTHLAYETESGRYFNRSNNVPGRIFHQAAGAGYSDAIELKLALPDKRVELFMAEYVVSSFGNSVFRDNFVCSLLENGTVALITSNACVKDDSWRSAQSFLREALGSGVTKVIFDLRQNIGGDSSVWDPFAGILELEPSFISFGVIRRHSPLAKATTLRNQNVSGDYSSFLPKVRNVTDFALDLAVLVEERTFSSAMFLVGYVKDSGLGRIVGRTPRNTVTHFGYPAQFTMPNTHLVGGISTCFWIRPDPSRDAASEPLVDIEVPYGEDILERALKEMR